MNNSLRRTSVRRSRSLLAASLVASSALLVASAGALAGRVPTVDFVGDPVCVLGTGNTAFHGDAEVSYKGKWVNISWEHKFGDGAWLPGGSDPRFDSANRLVPADRTVSVEVTAAQFRVNFFDGKDDPVGSVTTELACNRPTNP